MPMSYRLKRPVTVVAQHGSSTSLRELPAGSVVLVDGRAQGHNGMIDGTCSGKNVLVFLRDLEERAEPVALYTATSYTTRRKEISWQ